jgi:hypothetical protein
VAESKESELDERISRVVQRLLCVEHADSWMNSAEAAAHLRMSKHHFLRLCRNGKGPVACGEGRMQRWRKSLLDDWQLQSGSVELAKPSFN